MFLVDCFYNKHSGYLTHAETVQEAVSKANWARNYYEPMYPETVTISLWEMCTNCNGTGRIAKGRKNVRFAKFSDCPLCQGEARFPVPFIG